LPIAGLTIDRLPIAEQVLTFLLLSRTGSVRIDSLVKRGTAFQYSQDTGVVGWRVPGSGEWRLLTGEWPCRFAQSAIRESAIGNPSIANP
jgi:hypothetical protein